MGASSRRRLASDPRPSGIGKVAAAVSEASRGPSRNLGGDAARGVRLPLRYSVGWYEPFEARLLPALSPGVRILDVGSGRQPALLPARRPPACTYVGLDISRTQLEQASAGSYDEVLEGDITLHERSLQNRFDLLVSWQLLEHIRPLEAALENMRLYLRPGGTMVSLLSGGRSVFTLINRLVPTMWPSVRCGCFWVANRPPSFLPITTIVTIQRCVRALHSGRRPKSSRSIVERRTCGFRALPSTRTSYMRTGFSASARSTSPRTT